MVLSELGVKTDAAAAPARAQFTRKRVLFAVSGLVLVLAAVLAHIRIVSAGPDFQGKLAMLDRAFDLLLTLAIWALSFCVGRHVCRKLSLSFDGAAEELAFSTMLGTGVAGITVLGMGLAGLLRPLPLLIAAALFLLAVRREVVGLSRLFDSLLSYVRSSRLTLITALLFASLVSLMAVRALTPPHCYDEAIYHLAVPKLFVQQGRLYPVVDNFMGDMPFLIHMIYSVCLIAKSDIAAKLFSLALSVTTSIALYAFCARFLSRRIGVVALFGFFSAGMVVEVSITARIDVTLAGMIFLAFYAMAVYLETEHRAWFYCSALLSGFALGIKYTGFVGLIVVLVMYCFESLRRKTRLTSIARSAAIYGGISLALFAPWLAKNAIWFHNPIYPYVTGQVAEYEPGKVRYYDRRDELKMDAFLNEARRQLPEVVAEEEETLVQAASTRPDRHPLRFWEYFTSADKYNVADYYVDPNYLFVAAPLLLFLGRPRWVVWCALAGVGFYLGIAPAAWVARYLLPVYPPLTIVAAYALVSLADTGRRHARVAAALPTIALAVSLMAGVLVGGVSIYRELGLNFLCGSLSRRHFMFGSFYFESIDYVNTHVPPGEKVMLLGAEMGYDLNHPYIGNAGWTTNEWSRLMVRNDSMEGIRDDLVRSGVRYILFSPSLFFFAASTGSQGSGQPGAASVIPNWSFLRGSAATSAATESGPDYEIQLRNWATFSLFASRFAEPVKTWRTSHTLYRIK